MRVFASILAVTGAALVLGALEVQSGPADLVGGARNLSSVDRVEPANAGNQSARRLQTIEVWPWDVSPDGRYVTVIDWPTGGNLAVIDLQTGELQRLTDNASFEVAGGYAGAGVFSPDGNRVAYPWVQQDCGSGQSPRTTMEVRVIEQRPDARPRTVVPCRDDILYYSPWDWTPDGTGLLVVFGQADGSRRMTVVDVTTGSIREIATFPGDRPFERPRFSPDGRYVVYGAHRPGSQELDLYATPVGGGPEIALVQRPGDDVLFGWTEDDAGLISYNIDGLTSGLYRSPLQAGRPAGEAELVKRGLWRAVPIGQAQTGFVYVVTVQQEQVQTASIDIENGRVRVPFAPTEDPSIGRSKGGSWSPDGRYLAYLRTPSGEDSRLVIRSVDGSETREYPFRLDSGGDAIYWMPDGESLIVGGSRGELEGFFELDLQSGSATPLLLDNVTDFGVDWRGQTISPDGRTAILVNAGPGSDEIRAWDLTTEESRVVARAPFVARTAISPDGRTLAFTTETDSGTVNIVPLSGEQQPVRLYEAPDRAPWALQWTPDGRFLVWVSDRAIWRMPARGGDPVRVAELPVAHSGYVNLRLQPDGDGVSYTGGRWRGEVWLLQDVGSGG
jgi:Tol biopolymer transport system component